jgi:hypothetical protein
MESLRFQEFESHVTPAMKIGGQKKKQALKSLDFRAWSNQLVWRESGFLSLRRAPKTPEGKPEIKIVPDTARGRPARSGSQLVISRFRHGNAHNQNNSGIAAVDTRQPAETTEQVLEQRKKSLIPETVFWLPD